MAAYLGLVDFVPILHLSLLKVIFLKGHPDEEWQSRNSNLSVIYIIPEKFF